MKLIPKYKHAGTLNKEWVKDRDINGNWGYRNFKTGQFRTTLPNSQEEKKQEQTKRNNAVLKTYSANKTKFDESYESRRRNHSDETVKKVISKPQITMDKSGNANTGYSTQLAPGEDSAQLNTFIEEQIPIVKGFRLATGLGKLALSKLGSNEVSHWARNSLVNEAAGDITKEATMGNALFKTNKSGDLETGTSAVPNAFRNTEWNIFRNTSNDVQKVVINSPEAIEQSVNMVKKSPNFEEIVPSYTRLPYYDWAQVVHHGKLRANDFQKMWGEEIARRAEAMGNNMHQLQPMMVEGNNIIGTPYKLIQQQVSKPINVVSSKEIPTNIGGWHDGSDINVRLRGDDTPQRIISTQLHETAQHGTDDIISALPKSAVDTYYQPFIDKMSNFVVHTPDSKKWKELRATAGEYATQLYKVINRRLGNAIRKSGSLENYTNIFNKSVDDMTDQVLLKQLSNINSYGKDYAEFLTQNPQYIKEFKSLLKYAPATVPVGVSLPFLNQNK